MPFIHAPTPTHNTIMPVNHESLPIEPFLYRRVVKSISLAGLYPPSEAFSQVQPPEHNTLAPMSKLLYGTTLYIPAGREPQAQVEPATVAFSEEARSQVHSPAGRARHEQRGPATAFSLEALEHVQ